MFDLKKTTRNGMLSNIVFEEIRQAMMQGHTGFTKQNGNSKLTVWQTNRSIVWNVLGSIRILRKHDFQDLDPSHQIVSTRPTPPPSSHKDLTGKQLFSSLCLFFFRLPFLFSSLFPLPFFSVPFSPRFLCFLRLVCVSAPPSLDYVICACSLIVVCSLRATG